MTAKQPAPTFGCDMATDPDLSNLVEIAGGKVINVHQLPLTKKSQVLLVLRTGGRITAGHRPGLLQLLGADDSPIPAWQTALKAAQASSAQSGDTHEPQ
ncbi:hypothetical protein [Stenotrophomonas maltophilia]|uniref:hypothetical protein n=1 Tax=Stenotrophomonas maltophilia TaxID=40324 RepID=UPI001FA6EAA6|nr:hypothetical protein [Stenotrophomonas maltophilia]